LFDPPGRPLFKLPGANRRWRWPFRCRGSRRESAVAQLFSLGRVSVCQQICQNKRMKNQTLKACGMLLLTCSLFGGCSRSASNPRTTSATETIKGQFIGPAQLVDAGNTTPEAAMESGFWMQSTGDYDAVMASTEPQTQADAQGWLGDKATFRARSQTMFASFQGLQILARKAVATDRVDLKYQFAFKNPPAPKVTKIIEMVKVNGAWRGGHTRAYDASWDDGSEPEPKL
jgi:hypothetical protein